jgi:hypothetical protein
MKVGLSTLGYFAVKTTNYELCCVVAIKVPLSCLRNPFSHLGWKTWYFGKF